MEIESRELKRRLEANSYDNFLTQLFRLYSLSFSITKPSSYNEGGKNCFLFYDVPTFYLDLPRAEDLFRQNLQEFGGNSSLVIFCQERHEEHRVGWQRLARRKIIYPPRVKLFYSIPFRDEKATLVHLSVPSYSRYGTLYFESVDYSNPKFSMFKKSATATKIRQVNARDLKSFNEILNYVYKTSLFGVKISQKK